MFSHSLTQGASGTLLYAIDPDGKLGLVVQGAALAAQLGGAAGRRGRIFGQWSVRPILFAEKGGKKCANFGA